MDKRNIINRFNKEKSADRNKFKVGDFILIKDKNNVVEYKIDTVFLNSDVVESMSVKKSNVIIKNGKLINKPLYAINLTNKNILSYISLNDVERDGKKILKCIDSYELVDYINEKLLENNDLEISSYEIYYTYFIVEFNKSDSSIKYKDILSNVDKIIDAYNYHSISYRYLFDGKKNRILIDNKKTLKLSIGDYYKDE